MSRRSIARTQQAFRQGLAFCVIATSVNVSPAFAELSNDQVQQRREQIHNYLLEIYTKRKQRPQALAEYAILIGYRPNDAKLRYSYGRFLANSNVAADIANGITQVKKAVELEPGNFTYLGVLGALFLKSKKPDQALPYLKLAVQYGGTDYKKTYDETYIYIEEKKRADAARKKSEAAKRAAAAAAKAATAEGGAKSDDDDDW